MFKNYNITVVGLGYVGMSLSVLLAQKNSLTVFDIDHSRIKKIENKISTVKDEDIQEYLQKKNIEINPTTDKYIAYKSADFVIIATPTNFNEQTKEFDTESINQTVQDVININPNAFIVIKSTIPIGYTKSLQEKYKTNNIFFSPEFLREGKALHDNLYPSRIVIGCESSAGKKFADILVNCAIKKDINVLHMKSSEAEAVKLFSNTYLAMRVAYFNELDTFAYKNSLDSKNIIDGLLDDSRIGNGYNNPSFGYGGYCLPKDTKQLLNNYKDTPSSLINAIVSSNKIRKNFIAEEIIKLKQKTVGFYRMSMKHNSDNHRSAAVIDIINILISRGLDIIIFEPNLKDSFNGIPIINDLNIFKERSDIIIANRNSNNIHDVSHKVFTRDIYREN